MAGHLREIRKGELYELTAYAGRDPVTNKKRQRTKRFHGGRRAAERALAAFVVEVEARDTNKTEATVARAVEEWLRLQQDAGVGDDTLRTYQSYAKTWIVPLIGSIAVSDLKVGHLREMHAKMTAEGKRPATIRQVHQVVRGSLTFAVERGWVATNVAALRKPPKLPPSDVVAATNEELALLLKGAGEGTDLWAAIVLGAALGRRLGQLCEIRWSHVDLEAQTITVQGTRKSPKVTTLGIDPGTVRRLRIRRAWQDDRYARVFGGPHPRPAVADPYVLSFISDGSGPPLPNSYSKAFARLRDSLDLDHLHFHCLRHWCATTLIDRGVPLPVVAERLGHSSAAVTARIYAHVVAGRSEEAAHELGAVLDSIGPTRALPPET